MYFTVFCFFTNQAREVAVEARTANTQGRLARCTQLRAIKDVPTRWGSTFEMLERLLQLEDHLNVVEGMLLL